MKRLVDVVEEPSICRGINLEQTPLLERERDLKIYLDEKTHVYYVNGQTDFISVTTWNHMHFSQFIPTQTAEEMMTGPKFSESKYAGMTKEQIVEKWEREGKDASQAGTDFHYAIECYYKGKPIDQDVQKTKEWSHFLAFARDHSNLKPYKSEWRVYDESLKLAGTIDMTFITEDGKIWIYDWKRCKKIVKENTFRGAITPEIKHIQDCNFWHYALQLNTYKYFLEKHYQREVIGMFIVSMHPDNESETYDKHELPNLQAEITDLAIVRKDMLKYPDYVTSTGEILKRQALILTHLAKLKPPRCKLTSLISAFSVIESSDWKFFNEAIIRLAEKRLLCVDPLCQEIWVSE